MSIPSSNLNSHSSNSVHGIPQAIPKDQNILIDAIINAKKDYGKLSPFPVRDFTNTSFFSRLWDIFLNFLNTVFGISIGRTPEDLKFQLAMNLFKTFDSNLTSSSEDLPFSMAFEAYYHTIKNTASHFGISEDKVEALNQCVIYAKEIESLSNSCSLIRHIRLKQLTAQINDRISTLKDNESLYLPGGYARYEKTGDKKGVNDISELLSQSFHSTHMIYEISKDPNNPGKILFRVINNCSEASHLMDSQWGILSALSNLNIPLSNELLFNQDEISVKNARMPFETGYSLPLKEFTENLGTLLEIQAIPHEAYNMNWLEKLYYMIREFITNLMTFSLESTSDSLKKSLPIKKQTFDYQLVKNSLPVFVRDLSTVKFYSIFQKFNSAGVRIAEHSLQSSSQKLKANVKDLPSALRITKLFSKTLLKNREPQREITLKVALFLDIYNTYCKPDRIKDNDIRSWVRSTLYSLKAYLEKRIGEDIYSLHVSELFQQILVEINEKETDASFALPGGSHQQPSSSRAFDPVVFKESVSSLKDVQEIKGDLPLSVNVVKDPPLKEKMTPSELFIEKFSQCEKLSNEKNLVELRYSVREAFDLLQVLDIQNIWDNLNPSELEKWSGTIHQLTGYLCQVHFGLNLPGPTSVQILQILQALKICVKLAQNNEEQTGFGSFGLEMSAFKDILKDDYLNLETEGPDIRKTINQIACRGKTLLKLTDANPIYSLTAEDQLFFNTYSEKFKSVLQGYHNLSEDFTPHKGHLNIQIIHLRRLKILAQALMAKYRTIGNPSNFNAIKNSLVTFLNSFTKNRQALEVDYIRRICSEIDQILTTPVVPGDFYPESYFFQNGKFVHMDPYFCHIDYDDNPILKGLGSPFIYKSLESQYKTTEPQVPPIFATKVLESVVSNAEGGVSNEEGFPIPTLPGMSNQYDMKYTMHYVPHGESHTERYHIENQERAFDLPHDIWTELKLTKTAPLGTRIPNTLEFFNLHPNYLGSSPYAIFLQRQFNLNLFRNNGLGDFLTLRPDIAPTVVSQLITLFAALESSNNIEGMLFIMHITLKVRSILKKLNENNDNIHSRKIYDEQIAYLTTFSNDKQIGKLTEWMEQFESKKNQLNSFARLIYQTFLLLHEDFDLTANSKELDLAYLKTWFKMRQIPQQPEAYNFIIEDRIHYMLYKYLPSCVQKLNDEEVFPTFLNELAHELGLQTKAEEWRPTTSPWIFKNGSLSFDLKQGLVFKDGVASCRLPESVIQNPVCRSIFDNDTIAQITCNYKNVQFKNSIGYLCDFEHNHQKFAILLISGHEPFIYKQLQPSPGDCAEWFQYMQRGTAKKETTDLLPLIQQTFQEIQSPSLPIPVRSNVPESVLGNSIWVSCQSPKFIVENQDHQRIFEGEFEDEKKITENNIERIERRIKCLTLSKEGQRVLNPWGHPAFQHFLALGNPSQVLAASQDGDKVESIKYLNHSLEYQRNAEDKWECRNFPGYYLSTKSIESFFNGESKLNSNKRIFFAPQFKCYHILEHPASKPKLVLPFQEYKRPLSPYSKQNRIFEKGEASSLEKTFYDYTIEQGELKSTAEGYLYLAYVLFTQSQYRQALFYLRKAQNIKPETSPECQQILSWFSRWKATTLDAKVFMLHVHLLTLEQSPNIKKTTHFTVAQKKLLIDDFLKACSEYHFTQPLPYLRLTNMQFTRLREHIQLIADHENVDFIHLGSKGNIKEINKKLKISLAEIKKKFHITESSIFSFEEYELSKLEEEKNILETSIGLSDAQNFSYKYEEHNSPVFPELQKYLKSAENTTQNGNETYNIIRMIKHKYSTRNTDSFSDKLALELIGDIEFAQNQFSAKAVSIDDNDIESIKQGLDTSISDLNRSVGSYRQKIMNVILPHQCSIWHSLEQDLSNSLDSNPLEFNEILYAAASHELSGTNFQDYYNVMLKGDTNIEELERDIKSYLEKLTLLQQHQKAKLLLHNYLKTNPPSPTLKNALIDSLSIERVYNCQKDPHSIAILLLEATLEIIARKSQMENFSLMISKGNLVKHEALANGKTTFLRNLISKIKANRKSLSCVITYEPLIPLHHQQLEHATSEAYGDKVYRFEFNRDHPTDAVSLGIIRNNLLAYIEENARLDFTPHDILSLHHSLLLKYEEISSSFKHFQSVKKLSALATHNKLLQLEYQKAKKRLSNRNAELSVLSDIIEIFKTYATVTSDEFDKMVEANKQHNYGIGQPVKLHKNKCEVACSLVEWILSDSNYKSIFERSDEDLWKQAEDPQFINGFIRDMSRKFIDTYLEFKSPAIKQSAFFYFTSQTQSYDPEIQNFKKEIQQLLEPLQWRIKTFHKLVHKIIPDSFKKRNGLNLIRSKDGIQVKPVISNGKCSELSEFGTEEETLWYTCLNYMNSKNQKTTGGVTENQIAQLVLDLKNEAAQALAKQLKENPHSYLVFNKTTSARIFQEQFGMELDSVTPDMYPLLTQRINKSPKLLADFLKYYVFPVSDLRSEQIVGTPQHLIPLFKDFSGSSGTSNIWRSLPDRLELAPLQSGVNGAVFFNLIRTFSPEDLIKYNDKEDIFQQTAKQLKEGDALIDCAPIFPGMTAERIAQSLERFLPEKSQIRFTNEQDREVVWDNATQTIIPENPASIDRAITPIDKAQTRGTNKEMPYQSTGLVTINMMTTQTEFLQSVMRMRKFGKGQKIRLLADNTTYKCLIPGVIDKKQFMINLIDLLCRNESEFVKIQHIKSEIHKIQALGENALFELLLKLKKPENRAAVWKIARGFFIKPSQETLESLDDAELDSPIEGLKKLALYHKNELMRFKQSISRRNFGPDQKSVDTFNVILEKCLEKLQKKAEGFELLDPLYLPSQYYLSSSNLDMNNLVQKDQNIQMNRQIDQELDIDKDYENLPKPLIVFDWESFWEDGEKPSFENLLRKMKNPSPDSGIIPLKPYAKFYDSNLFFTSNLFKPAESVNNYESKELLPWTDSCPNNPLPLGQTRIFEMAIVVNRKTEPFEIYGILGTFKDFDNIFYKMYDPRLHDNQIDFYTYRLRTDALVGSAWREDYPLEVQCQLARLIVQAKHLAGEANLVDPISQQKNYHIFNQSGAFENWLEGIRKHRLANVVDLEKNLRKYLRTLRPSVEPFYSSSLMSKIYKKCKKKESQEILRRSNPAKSIKQTKTEKKFVGVAATTSRKS